MPENMTIEPEQLPPSVLLAVELRMRRLTDAACAATDDEMLAWIDAVAAEMARRGTPPTGSACYAGIDVLLQSQLPGVWQRELVERARLSAQRDIAFVPDAFHRRARVRFDAAHAAEVARMRDRGQLAHVCHCSGRAGSIAAYYGVRPVCRSIEFRGEVASLRGGNP